MMINKAMQRGGKVNEPGQIVEVELEADSRRPIVVPPVLKRALAKDPTAGRCFAELPDSWKRARINSVLGSKNKDVQSRRAAVIANKLAELSRAFREPPPIIKTMLAGRPAAKERFAKLPRSRRREFIAYILDASTEVTRERRAQQMLSKLLSEAGEL
jgi:uncharacterized protein YdeI (YjbR/CyaY-like superfamily)